MISRFPEHTGIVSLFSIRPLHLRLKQLKRPAKGYIQSTHSTGTSHEG